MFEILNNEEIKKEIDKETEKTSHWTFGYMSEYKAIAKAQRDKDIREVKEILFFAKDCLETAQYGDYSNGNTAWGIDEGTVKAREHLIRLDNKFKEYEAKLGGEECQ